MIALMSTMYNANIPQSQFDADFSKMADTEQEITLIFTSLLSETQVITAPEAAVKINDLLPHQPQNDGNKKSPGGFLAAFWDLAFQIVVQLDYQTQQMQEFISFVKALRDLPSTAVLKDGRRLWQDLPDLSLFFTERWNRKLNLRFLPCNPLGKVHAAI